MPRIKALLAFTTAMLLANCCYSYWSFPCAPCTPCTPVCRAPGDCYDLHTDPNISDGFFATEEGTSQALLAAEEGGPVQVYSRTSEDGWEYFVGDTVFDQQIVRDNSKPTVEPFKVIADTWEGTQELTLWHDANWLVYVGSDHLYTSRRYDPPSKRKTRFFRLSVENAAGEPSNARVYFRGRKQWHGGYVFTRATITQIRDLLNNPVRLPINLTLLKNDGRRVVLSVNAAGRWVQAWEENNAGMWEPITQTTTFTFRHHSGRTKSWTLVADGDWAGTFDVHNVLNDPGD